MDGICLSRKAAAVAEKMRNGEKPVLSSKANLNQEHPFGGERKRSLSSIDNREKKSPKDRAKKGQKQQGDGRMKKQRQIRVKTGIKRSRRRKRDPYKLPNYL